MREALNIKMLTALLLIFVLSAPLLAQPPQKIKATPLVFTHVTVIDGTGAPAKPDMTVVIIGDRINAIGETQKVALPRNARVVDGKGKFMIPGLWDMHVHTFWGRGSESFLPLFVANGVTGVRDMGAPSAGLALLKRWRREIARGVLLGPRIVAAGPYLDGPRSGKSVHLALATPDEARRAVDSVKRQGWDFVKVHDCLAPNVYLAIAAEAKRQGLPFAGHVPICVSAADASDAGQRSFEHLGNVLGGGLLVDCSTDEAALRAKLRAGVMKLDEQSLISTLRAPTVNRLLATYSAQKAERLAALLARNGTWQVPTIYGTLWSNAFELDDSLQLNNAIVNDPRIKYLPASTRPSSDPKIDPNPEHFTAEDVAAGKRQYRKQLELISILRRAGVQFMTGSDAEPTEGTIPGFSLQDELALFVEAGFTPMEALQAATLNPAKFLGKLDTFGTVATGKIADLVLLDANPLDDINNTRKINAVVFGGRLLNKSELVRVLAKVEAIARKS